MEPFFTDERRWPPGHRSLELYLLPTEQPENGELRELIGRCTDVLAIHFADSIAVSPPHITILI